MKIEYLDRITAKELVSNVAFPNNIDFQKLSYEYKEIQENIYRLDKECSEYKAYQYDFMFGLKLYEYFNKQQWFNNRIASSYDFWSFISIMVAPEVVFNRHGVAAEYYYKKNVRIYFFTLYWYIHLSWQGSYEKTKNCLIFNSTDTIQASVERPGKNGVHLDVFREIFRIYGNILYKEQQKKQLIPQYVMIDKLRLFRDVMMKHTAKCLAIQPKLYKGGIIGYVKMLFGEAYTLGE